MTLARYSLILISVLTTGCNSTSTGPENAESPNKATPKKVTSLSDLQGGWRVVSTSGQADKGHVFLDSVGKTILFEDDIMHLEYMDNQITKKIVFRPEVSGDAIDVEPDDPKWKTWSRIGIARIKDGQLQLCLTFPQGPRPTTFEHVDDGRELIILQSTTTDRRNGE